MFECEKSQTNRKLKERGNQNEMEGKEEMIKMINPI